MIFILKSDSNLKSLAKELPREKVKGFKKFNNLKKELENTNPDLIIYHAGGSKGVDLEAVYAESKWLKSRQKINFFYLIGVSGGDKYIERMKDGGIDAVAKPGKLLRIVKNLEKKMNISRESALFRSWEFLNEIKKAELLYYQILAILVPLHLALQAFFGISRDENGNFVKIGTKTVKRDEESHIQEMLRNINEEREHLFDGNENISTELTNLSPNLKAFLLAPDAKWDFYAELGCRFTREKGREKSNSNYDQWAIIDLSKELFKLCYNSTKYQTLNNNDKKKVKNYETKVNDIFENRCENFISLFAILVNIPFEQFERTDKIDITKSEYIERLPKTQNELGSSDVGETHSKWPKDIYGDGNQPDESYTKNLIPQLVNWNKSGKKAQFVIEKIDDVSNFLEQAVKFIKRGEIQWD